MGVSRREFFTGLGAVIGTAGLHGLLKANTAHGAEIERNPVGPGKVGIQWLGHGSFLFISCKGKKILLDPWLSTNPKCPGKYRKKGCFGMVDLVLWTHEIGRASCRERV